MDLKTKHRLKQEKAHAMKLRRKAKLLERTMHNAQTT